MYRVLKNLKDKKAVKIEDLSKLKKVKPTFKSKAKFRAWCAESDTDHAFYSGVEGDNPSARVTRDNPANKVTAIIADFDAPVDWDIVEKLIKTQCKGHLPTWYNRTQSGYIRLVWEFETPLPISPDMFDAFMRHISVKLGLERIFAGFDKSSLKPTQYFELGEDWTKMGGPLPPSFYRTALIKAASSSPPTTSETNIPIEVLAKEVEKRFPGRCSKEFEVGERVELFWIDDGIDREGGQITADGIICYSDRAGKGFVSWREIFGPKFVEAFETKKMGNLLDQYWHNGKQYYKLIHGIVRQVQETQVILELRQAGFSEGRKKGQALSEVESAKLSICNENRVDEIAPCLFSEDRIVEYNSHRILNNSNISPVLPDDDGDPSKWPFLHEWLNQLFANSKNIQSVEYFFAWLKIFYTAVLNKEPAQGQALLLVGLTNRGKSLLSNRVISALVGGFADASEYLSGHTPCNNDLAGKATWVIDDTTSAASFQDQRKATELIKKCVANPRIEYHAKYVDPVSVPWTGRVVMRLNMDANSLSVIPALDTSNKDKILALRISKKATNKFPPNVDLEYTIKQELPHFARWLLESSIPAKNKGSSRFGIKSYIDESIASAAYDNSSRSTIAELVEFFAKRARDYFATPIWRGTLTELQVAIHEFNGGRHVGMSGNLEFVRRGMLILEESSKSNKKLRPVKSAGFGGGKIWEIDLDESFDIDGMAALNSHAEASK